MSQAYFKSEIRMENQKMKEINKLINDLRQEHNALNVKISSAKFALATLPLDDQEKVLLDKQVSEMELYAHAIRERARYARKKQNELSGDAK
jgi:predicted secreted protein